jgi:hypothetical protein
MRPRPDYYHIFNRSNDSVKLDRLERERARDTWLCTKCGNIQLGYKEVDIRLDNQSKLGKPLNSVEPGWLGVVWKEFFATIDPNVAARDFWFGSVLDAKGNILDGWASYHGRHRLIVRGTKDVSHRVCERCGQLNYFSAGDQYLCPEPPRDARMYASHVCGIILPTELFERLDTKKWHRKLWIVPLTVELHPKDGLPTHLGEPM